jgi:pimeloyl-ACP methyl ester carboxylesterase
MLCRRALLLLAVLGGAAFALAAAEPAAEGTAAPRTITHEQIEAKYADAQSRFTVIDDVRLHYKDEGHGPAILLIHGSLGDLADWDGWAAVLTQHYRVVRFDLPGFGLSGEITNGNYSIDRSLSLIDGLMDSLGIERFAIAGVSYGGPIAFRYAATRVDRIAALVIMNSAGIENGKQKVDPKTGRRDFFATMSSGAALTREYVSNSLSHSFNDPARIPPGLIDRKLEISNVIGRDREGAIMIGQYVRGNPQQVLAHVRAPTLVLWGAAERSLSVGTADLFVTALKNAHVVRKVMQERGDHSMHIEWPEATASEVRKFLRSEYR